MSYGRSDRAIWWGVFDGEKILVSHDGVSGYTTPMVFTSRKSAESMADYARDGDDESNINVWPVRIWEADSFKRLVLKRFERVDLLRGVREMIIHAAEVLRGER